MSEAIMNMNEHDEVGQEEAGRYPRAVESSDLTSLEVDLSATSHPGHGREDNQESYLVMRFGRSLESLSTNLSEHLLERSYNLTGYGILIADGGGISPSKEVASRVAIANLIELILDTSDWTLALRREMDVRTVLQRMTQRFLQIDEVLREEAKQHPALATMGTTLTVAAMLGTDLVIGHVGNSRAYLCRGNELKQLTTDHTLAQALIDAGVANRDDPATRSMRHVLTAAIGSPGERINPQVETFKLNSGDRILLCSDGLTGIVNDKTIADVLRDSTSSENACQTLIDLALAAGGVDSITAVVAFVSSRV
jgi:protein phosphatase